MAWPNINERREAVAIAISLGAVNYNELARRFSCSDGAIRADVSAITRPYLGASVHVGASLRRRVVERDARTCQYCGEVPVNLDVDHVLPMILGGVAKEYNLVVACHRCNCRKGSDIVLPRNFAAITKDHAEWRSYVLAQTSPDIESPKANKHHPACKCSICSPTPSHQVGKDKGTK